MMEAQQSKLRHNDEGRWHKEKVLFELLGANDNAILMTFVNNEYRALRGTIVILCKGVSSSVTP